MKTGRLFCLQVVTASVMTNTTTLINQSIDLLLVVYFYCYLHNTFSLKPASTKT